MKTTEPATAMISTCRKESAMERLDQPGDEGDGRDEEDGNLRARGERDLGGELDVPAVGDDEHRPAVLGGVPDDGDDDRRDEELGQPYLVSANASSVWTSVSATNAVITVAPASTPSESRSDQAFFS